MTTVNLAVSLVFVLYESGYGLWIAVLDVVW